MKLVKRAQHAILFTGQGSARPKMGMDSYTACKVSRRIWDRSDHYLKAKYGFSILDIIRTNPDKVVIDLKGSAGDKFRNHYLDILPPSSCIHKKLASLPSMTQSSSSFKLIFDSASVRVEPSLPSPACEAGSTKESAGHEGQGQGQLMATQFQQPSLLLFENIMYQQLVASSPDSPSQSSLSSFLSPSLSSCALGEDSLVHPTDGSNSEDAAEESRRTTDATCYYAGHSLGEFSALSCLLPNIPTEVFAELVFARGLLMRTLVDDASRRTIEDDSYSIHNRASQQESNQNGAHRNADNDAYNTCSPYRMVAVLPDRAKKGFGNGDGGANNNNNNNNNNYGKHEQSNEKNGVEAESMLPRLMTRIVDTISHTFYASASTVAADPHSRQHQQQHQHLLEVVNYNTKNSQLVVAGDLLSLEVMKMVLGDILRAKRSFRLSDSALSLTQMKTKNSTNYKGEAAVDDRDIIQGFIEKACGQMYEKIKTNYFDYQAITASSTISPVSAAAGTFDCTPALIFSILTSQPSSQSSTPSLSDHFGFLLQPTRGRLSLPLANINIPFHSSLLSSGIPHFRSLLVRHIIDPLLAEMDNNGDQRDVHILSHLEDCYIPNLTGTPFSTSTAYVEEIQALTQSELLEKALWIRDTQRAHSKTDEGGVCETDDCKRDGGADAASNIYSRTSHHVELSLLLEVLTYQLASPVQWSKTIDTLLTASMSSESCNPSGKPDLYFAGNPPFSSNDDNDGDHSDVNTMDEDQERNAEEKGQPMIIVEIGPTETLTNMVKKQLG